MTLQKIIIVQERHLLNSIFFFKILLFIANLFSLFYFLIFYSLQIASIWIFDANPNELKVTPSTWLLIASTLCYMGSLHHSLYIQSFMEYSP